MSAPVPGDYAAKYDAENPSAYGEHQVATGPYMVENDDGNSPTTRPARRSTWSETRTGTRTPTGVPRTWTRSISRRASRTRSRLRKKILTARPGERRLLPHEVLKEAARSTRTSSRSPERRQPYVAFKKTEPPFDDINVRKAMIANRTRRVAQHPWRRARRADRDALPPAGIPGFEEAGGRGPRARSSTSSRTRTVTRRWRPTT